MSTITVQPEPRYTISGLTAEEVCFIRLMAGKDSYPDRVPGNAAENLYNDLFSFVYSDAHLLSTYTKMESKMVRDPSFGGTK